MKYANLQSILSEIFLALVLNHRSSCKVQTVNLVKLQRNRKRLKLHGRRHLEGLK